jgi:hypothetical protein
MRRIKSTPFLEKQLVSDVKSTRPVADLKIDKRLHGRAGLPACANAVSPSFR